MGVASTPRVPDGEPSGESDRCEHASGARTSVDRDVVGYYDASGRADALDAVYGEDTALAHLYRDRIERIVDLLAGWRGGRLLSVGCGPAYMLKALAERRPGDFELVGLDNSQEMLAVAARNLAGAAELVCAPAEAMPFQNAAFDAVLAIGVLEYTELHRALAEIARVTRPAGLVVATMQNPHSPYRLWEKAVYRHARRLRGLAESPIRQRLSERALGDALLKAGIVPTGTVYYDFNVFVQPLDDYLPGLERRVERLLARYGRGPLRRLGTGYIVSARRATAAAGSRLRSSPRLWTNV